ncbi:hypothetical protein H1230_19980 [Paenibacillus sp. 19GGS1-52]|uniref:hypothetical protein n=1 Tax=Paenibacillus sp. 19GGS1-52 TaxID=2758563 RepID=UPI001EFB27C6|nr:hypothetical protein [Paenibacillus sp. 19GGS1-52]ULO05367.1 hypothetical protein H1230_19980 [Paenibacillus sp. 19GGS1-52]
MGIDFTAFLGHELNRDEIQILCHALNSRSLNHVDEFITLLLPHNPKDKGKPWTVHEGIGGTVEINGPCGVQFTFSEKVCYFHHYIRWRSFLLDEKLQLYLKKVTFDLASYFKSTFAIYVPDSGSKESGILDFIWEDENKDVDYIMKWLLERCGTPKEKIIDIYKEYEDYWDSEGYYIDYFSDLK